MRSVRSRILVAMSGGVDSSVAAALLHEAGYECVGVTLHLWDAQGRDKVGRCCAPEDREDARRTCEALGIAHYVLDEREAFRRAVVDPFVEAYLGGKTPSPCVSCNREVKIARLVELADALGCTHIATGHYARLERDEAGRIALLRGRDATKDQSYFLHGLPAKVLERLVFPLGDRTKAETREEGKRLGVPGWDKKDSQELCFVPDGDVGGFIERRAASAIRPGAIVGSDGTMLGAHGGIHRFTVGQRRGLGLGGGPVRYVLRVLPERNEVVVGDAMELWADEVEVDSAHWIGSPPEGPFEANVQARYRHIAAPCVVSPHGTGFRARFRAPQRALTPGQAAVVYDGERVLGGGPITRVSASADVRRSPDRASSRDLGREAVDSSRECR